MRIFLNYLFIKPSRFTLFIFILLAMFFKLIGVDYSLSDYAILFIAYFIFIMLPVELVVWAVRGIKNKIFDKRNSFENKFYKESTISAREKAENSIIFEAPTLTTEYSLESFTDIEFRALNKLKKSKVDGVFQGELSIKVDRDKFCEFCLSANLIRYSTEEEDKNLVTISDCKNYLRSHSLKVSGNKDELIERIENTEDNYFGRQHYMLTDNGFSVLRKHWETRSSEEPLSDTELLIGKLKKYQISRQEFDSFKKKIPFDVYDDDVIWGILNERVLNYSYDYRKLRDNYLNMALFMESEKNYTRALEYYFMTICFDANGYTYTGEPQLILWIMERIYYLRYHYNESIAETAYSQCHISKEFVNEFSFLGLCNEIAALNSRPNYGQNTILLHKYISE